LRSASVPRRVGGIGCGSAAPSRPRCGTISPRPAAALALPADAKTRPVRLEPVSVDAAKAMSLRVARELPEKK
jgi:hypothetical protein